MRTVGAAASRLLLPASLRLPLLLPLLLSLALLGSWSSFGTRYVRPRRNGRTGTSGASCGSSSSHSSTTTSSSAFAVRTSSVRDCRRSRSVIVVALAAVSGVSPAPVSTIGGVDGTTASPAAFSPPWPSSSLSSPSLSSIPMGPGTSVPSKDASCAGPFSAGAGDVGCCCCCCGCCCSLGTLGWASGRGTENQLSEVLCTLGRSSAPLRRTTQRLIWNSLPIVLLLLLLAAAPSGFSPGTGVTITVGFSAAGTGGHVTSSAVLSAPSLTRSIALLTVFVFSVTTAMHGCERA